MNPRKETNLIPNRIKFLCLEEQERSISTKSTNFAYLSGTLDDGGITGPFVQLNLIEVVESMTRLLRYTYYDSSYSSSRKSWSTKGKRVTVARAMVAKDVVVKSVVGGGGVKDGGGGGDNDPGIHVSTAMFSSSAIVYGGPMYRRFLTTMFSSSAIVYGWPKVVPCIEDFPLVVTNPYGRTKV
ncbi:hypothetical protein DVH24_020565 [Malus domestica]|uniref:Uncharacterized protein n=1 Tax=Malus domestica TaxID=3750 RepID=A0A498JCV9_MALDO|nr:hypothetical protein DVH24_020565 [Malus domestica]